MKIGIYIFGASGSGSSTLGRAISDRFSITHVDTDDFIWKKTDPPFSVLNDRQLIISNLQEVVNDNNQFILSGPLGDLNKYFSEFFSLVIFLHLSDTIRMKRLMKREKEKYGERIQPGGDMFDQHSRFMRWASLYHSTNNKVRNYSDHKFLLNSFKCPTLSLNSSLSIDELLNEVVEKISSNKANLT
jgi:adenylate kinase family enzyme